VDDRRQYALRAGFRDERAGITIDSFGFRESSPQAGPTGPLIICAGDSVPFGAGVKDHETYSSYLAQLLPANGWAGGVLNAGVPSYNLRQTFDRIRLDVLPRVPSARIVVVVIEAANDVSLLTYYKEGWTPDRTWADVRWSASWLTWPQFQKVALVFYSAELGGRDRSAAVPPQAPIVKSFPGAPDDKSGKALDNVRKVLRTELAFLRDHSIPVVLLPINPFYYQTAGRDKNPTLRNWVKMRQYVEDWDGWIAQYNDVLAGTSKEFPNAYFFDMRPVMDAFDRDAMYLDFLHHSPLGNQIQATALLDFLIKRGLLSVRREVGT
jgi:lysophospholipase L1-like esterase